MRVLLVTHSMIPSQMQQWRHAAASDIDLHIAGTLQAPPAPWWTTEDLEGLPTHLLKPLGWISRGIQWWTFPGLGRVIRRLRPDLIQVEFEPWSLVLSQVIGSRSLLVGQVSDNIWFHGFRVERWARVVRSRRMLSRMAGLAGWNHDSIALARRYGLPPAAPTAIAPTRMHDPEPFHRAAGRRDSYREAFGLTEDLAVGFVGRLVPEKGVAWLLASAASVSDSGIVICIFGSGPDERVLREMAARSPIPVRFFGDRSPADIPGVMAALDVLVVPSLTTPSWAEQFGRVVVEAMFARTPVISSDSGSLPEAVGLGGVLVPEADEEALASAIDDLARSEHLRETWAAKGFDWAHSNWSPKVIGRRFADLWQRASSWHR